MCLCLAIAKFFSSVLIASTYEKSKYNTASVPIQVFFYAPMVVYGLIFIVDSILTRDCYCMCILLNINRNYKV